MGNVLRSAYGRVALLLAATIAAVAFAADPPLLSPSVRLQPVPAPLDQQIAALQQQVQALQQQVAALQSVLTVASDGSATLRAPNVRIETITDLSLRSSQHVRVESGTDLQLRGGTDVTLQGSATASIKGGSTTVEGLGTLALNGGVVRMNNGGMPVAKVGSPVANNAVQSGSPTVFVN